MSSTSSNSTPSDVGGRVGSDPPAGGDLTSGRHGEEYERLGRELGRRRQLHRNLDDEKRPNSYWAHSDPGDAVAGAKIATLHLHRH